MPFADVVARLAVPAFALCVAGSWYGYGARAAQWARGRRHRGRLVGGREGVGLCVGWGMAVSVLIGGVLNATRTCSYWTVGAVVLVGLGLALRPGSRAVRRAWRATRLRPATAVPLVAVTLIALFGLIASGSWRIHGLNLLDDTPFYTILPQRMLQAGAALDPLCARRLSTFGGYAFLQAELGVLPIEANSGAANAFVLDMGLAPAVMALLLLGWARPRTTDQWGLCLAAAACWLFPVPRVNSQAELAITALMLATVRTVFRADAVDGPGRTAGFRRRLLVLAALTATAACTFRANVTAWPPLFFTLYFAWRAVRARQQWRRAAGEWGRVAATGLATLLPWSLALYQAGGSLLYPLMRGNDGTDAFVPPTMTLAAQLNSAYASLAAVPLALTVLPLVVLVLRRRWTALLAYAAAMITSCITVMYLTSLDPLSLIRLYTPLLLTTTLLALADELRLPALLRIATRTALVMMAVAFMIAPAIGALPDVLSHYALAAADLMTGPPPALPPDRRRATSAMQATVPPGAVVAATLTYPGLLDFGRNRIYNLDLPGAALVGRFPYQGRPEDLRQWLLAQGVQYLFTDDFKDPDGLFSARYWDAQARGGLSRAGIMLNLMRNVYWLGRLYPVVFDRDGVRAIRLTGPASTD